MTTLTIPSRDIRDESPVDLTPMAPCRICSVMTPIESICHVPMAARTFCPAHRAAVDTLAICGVEALIRRAEAAAKAAA